MAAVGLDWVGVMSAKHFLQCYPVYTLEVRAPACNGFPFLVTGSSFRFADLPAPVSVGGAGTGPMASLIIPAFGHGRTRKNTEDFFFFSVFRVLPWLKSPSVAGTMIKAEKTIPVPAAVLGVGQRDASLAQQGIQA